MIEPSTRLRNSIEAGNLAIVQRLIRRYPYLLANINPYNGWSSLHYAGYHGHYLICVYLVQQGHDKDEISLDHHRMTPLHLAASQNHEQTVHFLAQHIPRCLNWVNTEQETALMVAARYGHDPCINLLLDFGADIDMGNRELNRPIHIAAAYGHLKTLRTLVDRNADVQTPNSEGWRPVQYCSTYQVQDYLQTLIHEKSESLRKQQQKLTSSSYSPSSSTVSLHSPGSKPNVQNQTSPSPSRNIDKKQQARDALSPSIFDKPLPSSPPKSPLLMPSQSQLPAAAIPIPSRTIKFPGSPSSATISSVSGTPLVHLPPLKLQVPLHPPALNFSPTGSSSPTTPSPTRSNMYRSRVLDVAIHSSPRRSED